MSMSTVAKHYRPISKLQQLIDLKPARFPIGKGIRAGLSIGLTFALGLLSGYALEGVFVCIAALSFSAGEASNMTYRAMFRHTLIAASIGGLGAFAGVMSGLPWFMVIILMTIIAFVCAIISNYGMPYSVGTMIALIIGTVVIGMPIEGMGWKLFLCFQIGAAFYLLLLGCEALIDSHNPERQLLTNHIKAQAAYARIKSRDLSEPHADKAEVQKSLNNALDSYFTLYSALLNTHRSNSSRRSLETDHQAATLQALDSVLSHLRAINTNAKVLLDAASWLDALADAISDKSKAPPPLPGLLDKSDDLLYSLTRLSEKMWPSSVPSATPSQARSDKKLSLKGKAHSALRRLIVGKEATIAALVFAACMGTALTSKYFISANHWYWVPLTVAVTMKPDFGSIFARAVTRSLGTVVGALIGTIILFILPKDFVLVITIGVLAALLPWAKMISYTTQVAVLTAVLLVLLDLVSKTALTVNYAGQRVGDTIIASMIVLGFNYLLLPRSKHGELSQKFNDILSAIKSYLEAACQNDKSGTTEAEKITKEVFKRKITAYQQLSDLRTLIRRLVVEPAPVGPEATSWLPVLSAAQRLCDDIDVYLVHKTMGSTNPDSDDINYLLNKIGMIPDQKADPTTHAFSESSPDQVKAFLFSINDEINSLSKLLQKNAIAL